MTICCGRISLSLGADLSMGTTRMTSSPSSTRSDTRGRTLRSLMMTATRSLSSSMPSLFRALTVMAPSGISATLRSLLFTTTRCGILRLTNSFKRAFSSSPIPILPSMTRIAISVSSITLKLLAIRWLPSVPSSSIPGVSIITTGPRGRSSIVFLTGSVVVPATSETIDRSCEVKRFTRLDLPALRRPKKAMCVRSIFNHQYQNLKSRSPFSMATSLSRRTARAFSFVTSGIFFSIRISPASRVSGEA